MNTGIDTMKPWRQWTSLALLALAASAALYGVHAATSARIARQELQEQRAALAEVLPDSFHDNDLLSAGFMLDTAGTYERIDLLGLSVPRLGWRATLAGNPSGVILPLETRGYQGSIVLLIGIDIDGNITGVRAQQHSETPGLGDAIDPEVSRWILGFDNRSLANTDEVLWSVKKDGGDFDQFVGATITPRAVVNVVHDALLFFDANREALFADADGTEP